MRSGKLDEPQGTAAGVDARAADTRPGSGTRDSATNDADAKQTGADGQHAGAPKCRLL